MNFSLNMLADGLFLLQSSTMKNMSSPISPLKKNSKAGRVRKSAFSKDFPGEEIEIFSYI